MSETVRRGSDRASRLARAAALSGTSGKIFPADLWHDLAQSERLRPALMRLCALYLTEQRSPGSRIDPVARFHLGNGARLERFNWLGNATPRAIQESFGIMVNYLYDHDSIEDNHEAFVRDGTVVRSPDVDALHEA
jgi:malonyl-CoA decarboxylase